VGTTKSPLHEYVNLDDKSNCECHKKTDDTGRDPIKVISVLLPQEG